MSPVARIRQVAACLLQVAACLLQVPARLLLVAVLIQSSGAHAQGTQNPATQSPGAQTPGTQTERAPAPVQLAPNTPAVIAHSSLLAMSATAAGDALKIEIRRVADQAVVSADGVTATVDGKSAPVTRLTGGYQLPLEGLREAGPGHEVEVVVPHDGIRELLSGKVVLAHAGPADSFWGDHKQIAWWLLNIIVVFVAATAISRRKG